MSVKIIIGDVFDRLAELPDESVHCVVTSPPYWSLRDYGIKGQIGLEATFSEHIDVMVRVFREVRRVLRGDGTLWLNYGDAYYTDQSGQIGEGLDGTVRKGRRGRINRTQLKEYKRKDLMLMPARIALGLQTDGWWVRSEICWHKPNGLPEPAHDRPACSHEKIYLLTKSARYFYDAEAVRTAAAQSTLEHNMQGRSGVYAPPGQKEHRGIGKNISEKGRQSMTVNLRNVWHIPVYGFSGDHFATFPPQLVEPCIKAGTSEEGCCCECEAPIKRIVEASGGTVGKSWHDHTGSLIRGQRMRRINKEMENGTYTRKTVGWEQTCKCDTGMRPYEPCVVLDPFAGSGTTGLVADRLGRDAILIELNPEYAEMARKRIQDDAPLFVEVR